MKIFTLVLLCLMLYIPSHAQDLDTVWTHNLEPYEVLSYCSRFMPDGKSIIAGVRTSITNATLYEFETATGKILRKFEPEVNSNVVAIEISPDGKTIIGRSDLYEYHRWDYSTGEYTGNFYYNDVVKTDAASFVFHAIENKLYMTLRDTIILFNLTTKKTEKIGTMPFKGLSNLAVSKDGKYLAMSYHYLNNDKLYHSKLYLYDAIKWEIIRELDDITRDVNSVAISPNSKYVAFTTGENDGEFLRLYNIEKQTKLIYPRSFFGYYPYNTIFIDDNYLLLSGVTDTTSRTKLFQIDSNKTIYTINYGGGNTNMDMNGSKELIFDRSNLLALINTNWFTTSVPPDPRIKINENMKIKYMNEVLSLDNTDSELIKLINIFDINGKLVKTYDAGYSGAMVDLPFVAPAGVYLVRIVTDQSDYNFKFVRE